MASIAVIVWSLYVSDEGGSCLRTTLSDLPAHMLRHNTGPHLQALGAHHRGAEEVGRQRRGLSGV